MRTKFISDEKLSAVMISAIDTKIAEYKEKINEYNDLIMQLEVERRKYSGDLIENLQTPIRVPRNLLMEVPRSKRERLINAINRMSGKFDSEQLRAEINRDGGVEITKENFAPDFSRLKDKCYKRVGDKDGRGLYEKL